MHARYALRLSLVGCGCGDREAGCAGYAWRGCFLSYHKPSDILGELSHGLPPAALTFWTRVVLSLPNAVVDLFLRRAVLVHRCSNVSRQLQQVHAQWTEGS